MRLDRLTLVLLTSTVLLTAAAISLLLGAGQTVDWLPATRPRQAAPVTPPQVMQSLSLQALALTWQQSMFSPQRTPDLITGKDQGSLDGIRLTGVIITGQAQWVLLRMPDKHTLKLAVGSTLDNGWTLIGARPQHATFSLQGQTRELRLPLLRLPPPSKAPLITLPDVPTP